MPYYIGSGFSDKELAAAHWWVRHQIGLRRALFIGLGLFCALTWGYAIWVAFDTYVLSFPKESRIVGRIIAASLDTGTLDSSVPQALQSGNGLSFLISGNRQDLVAQLTNPNDDWWAEFTYHFDLGGEQTPEQQGFLMPQETFPIMQLGNNGHRTAAANLQITNVRWHRLDRSVISHGYPAFQDEHWQLHTEQLSYKNDLDYNGKKIGQTNFILKNNTGFGYWGIDVAVLVYRLDQLVGVNIVRMENLKPGESRPVSLNWFENLSGITKTVVIPHANVFDPRLYLSSERF